jgi:hypothetical protein
MALEDNAGAEGFVGLLNGLGGIEIEPVEVVLGGRTLRPGDEAARIDGDRFESRLHGIAFTLPKGFKFDPPGKGARMITRVMELDGKTTSGKPCEIEVDVMDAVPWEDLVASVRKGAPEAAEWKLDGRPAMRVVGTLVFVLTDRCVFQLRLDRQDGDAELKAFEEFLASVDFDVE